MPPQDDETNESPHSLEYYSNDDLAILHEIIALATTIPGNQIFRSIWKAYDTVLVARNIDSVLDGVYFRFILQLQGAPGDGLKEKFIFTLDKLGIDIDNTQYTDFSGVPGEITIEYNRSRFEEAKERRERARQSSSSEDEQYHAEDESQFRNAQATRRAEIRILRRARSPRDPRSDALKVANATAQKRRSKTVERRAASSDSDTGNYSADESAVLDTPHPELEALCRAFGLRKCLHHWRSLTTQRSEERWFEALHKRAEKLYTQRLLAKTWKTWVLQTAAIVQRTHEMRQRILTRKYFNAWKEFVDSNRKKVRIFQLQHTLNRWIDACRAQKGMKADALMMYRRNLTRRIYWKWYWAHCDVAMEQRYEERLVQSALYQWVDRAERVAGLHTMAKRFYRRNILQSTLSRWVYRMDDALEKQDYAEDQVALHRQQSVFQNWRQQAALAPLVKAMQAVVNDRVLYERFNAWRMRAKDEIAAAEMYKLNLIRRVFRNWRLNLRHDIMVEHHETLLKQNTLQHWARQERLQLLSRTHTRKVARKMLRLFTQKFKEKSDSLRKAYRQVAVNHRRILAQRIFDWWYAKTQNRTQRLQIAGERYRTALVEKTLNYMRARLDTIRTNDDWSTNAAYYFVAKHALTRWKEAANESRKKRIKATYQIAARDRKHRTASKFFNRWRNRMDEIWQQEHVANDFAKGAVEEQGLIILRHWHQKREEAMDDYADAEHHYSIRILGKALEIWIERNNLLQQQELTAQKMMNDRNLKLMDKCLSRWDTRFWEISVRRDTAIRWFERKETMRARSLFRGWRERMLQRQQRRDIADIRQLEGFGDVTIIPFREGAVTPPRGFKTPGWKTTGGHRRRGVLGNRSLLGTTPMGSPGSPLKRFAVFGRSGLGRVTEPDDEDEGTLVGSGSGRTIGGRSIGGGL